MQTEFGRSRTEFIRLLGLNIREVIDTFFELAEQEGYSKSEAEAFLQKHALKAAL